MKFVLLPTQRSLRVRSETDEPASHRLASQDIINALAAALTQAMGRDKIIKGVS